MRMNFLIAILLMIVACAPVVKFAPFGMGVFDQTDASRIIVHSSPDAVKREYKEIGLITANDDGWEKSEAELIAVIREKAAMVGADAIILQGQTKKDGGLIAMDVGYYQVTKTTIRAIVIKYTDILIQDSTSIDTTGVVLKNGCIE